MFVDLHLVTTENEPKNLSDLYHRVSGLRLAVMLADRVILNGIEVKNAPRPFEESVKG